MFAYLPALLASKFIHLVVAAAAAVADNDIRT